MIPKQAINVARKFAYAQSRKYGTPPISSVEYTNEKRQWLAKTLDANKNIVLLGTLLMDCKLGYAKKTGKLPEHQRMSAGIAKKILNQFPQITNEEKKNVLECILQHHGSKEFYSLEAEICCNADCYRFASTKGIMLLMKDTKDHISRKWVDFLSWKADEKWNALSIPACKKELRPQYRTIKALLRNYKE